MAFLLGVGAAVLAYTIYAREGSQTLRRQDTVSRFLRLGLRMGLLFLLLAVLLPRDRVWFDAKVGPTSSFSWTIRRAWPPSMRTRTRASRQVADRLAEHDGMTDAQRLSLAKALVTDRRDAVPPTAAIG